MAARLTRISIAFLTFGLLFATAVQAENVYRWVDENGKVHFGRTLPPEYSNKPYDIMTEQGVLLEHVDPTIVDEKPELEDETSDVMEPLFTEDEVRLRSDRLLVLRYHSEEDLIEAMENEVAQLGYDTRLINQSRASAMVSLSGQVGDAADRQRAGMPEDPELEEKISSLRGRLRNSEDQLVALKVREVDIRASFQANLERYRYLANGGTVGGVETEQN